MMVNVLAKVAPGLAKLGTATALELIGVASIGAGVVSFGMDKATDFAKSKLDDKLEAKQQEMLKKRADLLAKKAEQAAAMVKAEESEEVKDEAPVVKVEPKKPSKKK